ncbi:ephrin type-A receptor 5 isoform X5 [Hydra vulgaris]|uniref:Ephrin type-A receptor 5 isoform X5 n=1 Tax=Hydra vulgaris TaxID=6087 RepID=A0ABM4C4N6_HYDVU
MMKRIINLFIQIPIIICSQKSLTQFYCNPSYTENWMVKGNSCGSTFGETTEGVLQLCHAPNCTLRSQFYLVQPYSTIFLKIKMEIKGCSESNCKQTTLINIYTAMSCNDVVELKNYFSIPPEPLPASSQLFQTSEFIIEVKDLKKAGGIFIDFQADGFCGEIKSFDLFYFECSNTQLELANFPPKPAPNTEVAQLVVNGSCIENAINEFGTSTPVMICLSNGNYTVNSSCVCDKGFEKINETCKECSESTYKPISGNSKCISCGENSISISTTCLCNENFYRPDKDKEYGNVSCYAPGAITNLLERTDPNGVVTLEWNPPLVVGSDDLRYEVAYGSNVFIIKEHSFRMQNPRFSSTIQTVKITAVSYLHNLLFQRSQKSISVDVFLKGGRNDQYMILSGSAGGIIFILIILLILFIYWRKRHPTHLYITRSEDGAIQLKKFHFYNTGKTYVDPTTCIDLDKAVYNFTMELNQSDLQLGELLGSGEYGDVFLGHLCKSNETKLVAVKILKPDSEKRARDDFLSEAAILGQFIDPNVIKLEGIILKNSSNMIVLEFMPNGSLDAYLQKHELEFSAAQLLGMSRGIASGMKYLSELGYIHRDLAARNILVDKHNICKISDFGMSRVLTNDIYDTRGGKIPIRWTAPEAIQFKKFTTASDVWSFGILLWEIMSYGERPYWDWSNFEVMDRITSGYRLPPPMHCPKAIHDLMLTCWDKDRVKRPKFSTIYNQIEELIKKPRLLFGIVSTITKSDENLDYSVLDSIENWLEAIKMEQYTKLFTDVGLTMPKQILNLNLENLVDLGIKPIGHCNKILKAVKNTKQQIENVGPKPESQKKQCEISFSVHSFRSPRSIRSLSSKRSNLAKEEEILNLHEKS